MPVRRLRGEHEPLGGRVVGHVPERLGHVLGPHRLEAGRRAVDDDLEAAQLGRGGVEQRRHLGRLARLGRERPRPHAERLDLGPRRLGRVRARVVADRDVRAALREVERDGPAEPVRAAHHEAAAAVEGGHGGIC